ncbi:MAG: ATP-binding protein [Desulfovibrionaceae bacterium]
MPQRIREIFRPGFWNAQDAESSGYGALFNYRRIWAIAVGLLAAVALLPLSFVSFMDYNVTRDAVMSESLLRTARTTSNTRRNVTSFLDERRAALELIIKTIPESSLVRPERLAMVLEGLKESIGGFTDLGVIDETGRQRAYVGPYQLQGRDYSGQPWFTEAMERGTYISDVFLGYRDVPHLVVAVRFAHKGGYGVLRASIDTERFVEILSGLDLSGDGDVFIVNHEGVLQIPSRYHGNALERMDLPVPQYDSKTLVLETSDASGEALVAGYAYIKNSPFILMVVKRKALLMAPLNESRLHLLWVMGISVGVILLVILGVAASMVGRIHLADRKRLKAMRQMEHANRMASIGRLAAGVAHEINNPLAIINEKAGLIKDLFTYSDAYKADDRLMGLISSIISSVERCGTITKRLLGFARCVDLQAAPLSLVNVVDEVLGFVWKEAEYRLIEVDVTSDPDLPEVISDRGKLQQVFLNLVNNAFQAMSDGGKLTVTLRMAEDGMAEVVFADDGCGIPRENLERIFEPFFSTKKGSGGTGLGLSISYGLIKEMGGSMTVESNPGSGTAFTVRLPVQPISTKDGNNESSAG